MMKCHGGPNEVVFLVRCVFVEQNRNCKGKPVMDRRLRNSYHESKVTRGTVGKARLVSTGGPVGVSRGK